MLNLNDTIAAVATPPGMGGIGVIRVSGEKAKEIFIKVSDFPGALKSHTCFLVKIFNPQTKEKLDECVATYFSQGKSYTGEETIELSCHGNPQILESVLQALILSGARMADRGEFTLRAFLNGKIDLLQAEAIHSLIHATTKKAQTTALAQLEGSLSQELSSIKERITKLLAHVEANIDFSLENLQTMDPEDYISEINQISDFISSKIEGYRGGQIITEGYKVALVGPPNVGKSSLFNKLINKEKSIVTPIAGTTRDVIDADRIISGVKVSFFDTAGIRESEDEIEKQGIKRALKTSRDAQLILYVVDVEHCGFDFEVDKTKEDIVLVINKIDKIQSLSNQSQYKNFVKKLIDEDIKYVETSVYTQEGISELEKELENKIKKLLPENSAFFYKQRHYQSLLKTQENLRAAKNNLHNNLSHEFIALELREALDNLYEITGEKVDEEILNKIFKEFCLGK